MTASMMWVGSYRLVALWRHIRKHHRYLKRKKQPLSCYICGTDQMAMRTPAPPRHVTIIRRMISIVLLSWQQDIPSFKPHLLPSASAMKKRHTSANSIRWKAPYINYLFLKVYSRFSALTHFLCVKTEHFEMSWRFWHQVPQAIVILHAIFSMDDCWVIESITGCEMSRIHLDPILPFTAE